MGEGLQITRRLLEALSLKREPFQWMVFNSRSNGDAVLVVAGTFGVWLVIRYLASDQLSIFNSTTSNINFVLSTLVNGGFAWIIATGAAWALATYALDGSGRYGTTLPATGFAHAPLVLVPILSLVGLGDAVAVLLPLGWVFAMLVVGLGVSLELPRDKAAAAAGAWIVVWWIFFFLF